MDFDRITLAHGEGGRLTRRLIREQILPALANPVLEQLEDAAALPGTELCVTTDSYTVTPLFFPGGDIGTLAVYGTVNDLAVAGAIPRWISLALILEEGTPLELLARVLASVRQAARRARVDIVTGDTKVVPRGAVDTLFVNTTGIGLRMPGCSPGARCLRPDDVLIVSGPIGQHGAAILCSRESFGFEPLPESDCAPLAEPLAALWQAGLTPHAIRDATRGGVAAVLHEWAEVCGLSCRIEESRIPVTPVVRAVCELLGLDPIHLANEGTCVLATQPDRVEKTLEVLHRFEPTAGACVLGTVTSRRSFPVVVRRASGQDVILDDPAGAPLPRIC